MNIERVRKEILQAQYAIARMERYMHLLMRAYVQKSILSEEEVNIRGTETASKMLFIGAYEGEVFFWNPDDQGFYRSFANVKVVLRERKIPVFSVTHMSPKGAGWKRLRRLFVHLSAQVLKENVS